ncbi:hypothetical protein [Nocardioides caricicola]|uniref:DUF4192 family protein n=1 Tax=Nocardioides caricicola TaxID=634770 RepID=A0ABW0MVC7_9ACTN
MTDHRNPSKRTTAISLNVIETYDDLAADERVQSALASVRVRRVYGAMLLHREQDLYVAETDRHRGLQDHIRERLLGERFSLDDAEEWAYRNWYKALTRIDDSLDDEAENFLCDEAVAIALAYRDTGIPNDEAFAWSSRSVSATDAVRIRQHGWNPHAYSTLLAYCFQQAPHMEEADNWIASPVAWWRVLRYLRAGFGPREALDLEARRTAGEDVDPAIDLLISLTAPETP